MDVDWGCCLFDHIISHIGTRDKAYIEIGAKFCFDPIVLGQWPVGEDAGPHKLPAKI